MSRYDYILIWGHGLVHEQDILEEIDQSQGFSITRIIRHFPERIADLVKEIYSFDYAPFHHLKAKTKYLEQTPCEVLFIFVKNHEPEIEFFGKGDFRHVESLNLKRFKESLRDKFNPRKDGKRTEDHVIHASDNASQTEHILRYLGVDGLGFFESKCSIIDYPYFLPKPKSIHFKYINLSDLMCRTVDEKSPTGTRVIAIKESPQYKGIENPKVYESYLRKHRGCSHKVYYSTRKFTELQNNFDYLGTSEAGYIIAEKRDKGLIILDGLHRASILFHRGIEKEKIAIVEL